MIGFLCTFFPSIGNSERIFSTFKGCFFFFSTMLMSACFLKYFNNRAHQKTAELFKRDYFLSTDKKALQYEISSPHFGNFVEQTASTIFYPIILKIIEIITLA